MQQLQGVLKISGDVLPERFVEDECDYLDVVFAFVGPLYFAEVDQSLKVLYWEHRMWFFELLKY